MYCPTTILRLVVYDVVLSLLTVVQLLPELLLFQEYTSVPRPLALHMRVMFLPIGTSLPVGCRPTNPHGFAMSLTISAAISKSHWQGFQSHDF